MTTDFERMHWPTPRVEVPRGVPPEVGAAAWAAAFGIEVMADALTHDEQALRRADASVTQHRQALEGAGYELSGPVRQPDGALAWRVELRR